MKVLVTGGAGFIGRHLVARLLADRYQVVILDNLHRGRFELVPSPATCQLGDIRNPSDCASAVAGCDAVVHLAAQSNVLGSQSHSDYAVSTNVGGTWTMLEAAHAAGVKHVVFASSREVYGDAEICPTAEDAPLNPKNLYGATKVSAEILIRSRPSRGMSVSILRFANVIGMGDHDRVAPRWIDAALKSEPLHLYGGDQVMDFVPVDTAVDAIARTLDLRCGAESPINVGSGIPTTLRQLADHILAVSRSSSPVQVEPKRSVEVRRFVADVTRMRTILGVTPPQDPLAPIAQILAGAPRGTI